MQPLAVDPAIDDDVSDVETLRAVFPRHALGEHPEPGFRRSEMREARLSAEACGSAGEDDGAATRGTRRRAASRPTRKPPRHPTRQQSSNCRAVSARKSMR